MLINHSKIENKISQFEVILEQKLNNKQKLLNNKIYTINEQINLIHSDLQTLITNDKILLENYHKIIGEEDNYYYKSKDKDNFNNLNSIIDQDNIHNQNTNQSISISKDNQSKDESSIVNSIIDEQDNIHSTSN